MKTSSPQTATRPLFYLPLCAALLLVTGATVADDRRNGGVSVDDSQAWTAEDCRNAAEEETGRHNEEIRKLNEERARALEEHNARLHACNGGDPRERSRCRERSYETYDQEKRRIQRDLEVEKFAFNGRRRWIGERCNDVVSRRRDERDHRNDDSEGDDSDDYHRGGGSGRPPAPGPWPNPRPDPRPNPAPSRDPRPNGGNGGSEGGGHTNTNRQGVWAPLAAIDEVLENISDYDMTRPHEGARIIGESLVNVGLGWVFKGIGAGLTKLYGGTAKNVAAAADDMAGVTRGPVRGPGSPGTPILSWDNLPPGVSLEPHIEARVVHLQEQPASCAAASAKMVIETVTGRNVPESWIRQLMRGEGRVMRGPGGQGYEPKVGATDLDQVSKALRTLGVPNSGVRSADPHAVESIDALAHVTRSGKPAIVVTSDQTTSHVVVVDAVKTAPDGTRYLILRDPGNLAQMPRTTAELLRVSGFRNHQVLTEAEFAATWRGEVVFVP